MNRKIEIKKRGEDTAEFCKEKTITETARETLSQGDCELNPFPEMTIMR